METIHKKNGRLHIYVRQDKYKGELKSHNWVGRTYINGKQKVSSSGTTNLEEAIPILEKWFDELQLEKNDNNNINEQLVEQKQDLDQEKVTNSTILNQENTEIVNPKSIATDVGMQRQTKGVTIGMLEKFKNFKFSKSDKNVSTNQVDTKGDPKTKENKLKKVFQNFFSLKLANLVLLEKR